jgi:opacity protein-like surface antigen
MKNILIVLFILISCFAFGQDANKLSVNSKKGELSLGIRSTGSIFSASGNNFGIGAGWQLRYRMSEKFNTEWFADWITTDINGLGQRYDAHIGESMIIYPFNKVGVKNTFTPYIMGGFCGDYTKIETNLYFDDIENSYITESKDRWSFATQLGIGTHYNITEKFDISFSSQYVLHFGADLHSESETNSLGQEYLHIHQEEGGGLEGHWFLTISANFVFFDLFKNK